MAQKRVTAARSGWRLTAHEAAHAMPVLQHAHPRLRSLPAPRLATIRELARRSRIRDGALRTALSRACAAGSLELSEGRYRLGPLSLEEAAAARALLQRRRGYTLALLLEGQRRPLRPLRELFLRLGFRPLQRSVWVGARTRDDRLSAALGRDGFARSAVVFHADEVDAEASGLLARLWRLDERAAALRQFHRRLMAYAAAPRITPTEAAWRCVEVAPTWYRVAVHDEPPFPLDLCGPEYPLHALNAAWRAHLEARSPELVALWAEVDR